MRRTLAMGTLVLLAVGALPGGVWWGEDRTWSWRGGEIATRLLGAVLGKAGSQMDPNGNKAGSQMDPDGTPQGSAGWGEEGG